MPGLVRHYYDKLYWPLKIESCQDEDILQWLESHLVMIPMEPRRPGCSVVEGKDITETKVKALAQAADDCWQAILNKDLEGFAKAYKASFNAQTAMFPGMVHPTGVMSRNLLQYRIISILIPPWMTSWPGKCPAPAAEVILLVLLTTPLFFVTIILKLFCSLLEDSVELRV